MSAAFVNTLLGLFTFTYANEAELQAGVERALKMRGLEFERERCLGEAGRIDFLVERRIGVEVKVAGAMPAVLEQLLRYAACPEIDELVLVTTRASHSDIPRTLGGKPVVVHVLRGGLV